MSIRNVLFVSVATFVASGCGVPSPETRGNAGTPGNAVTGTAGDLSLPPAVMDVVEIQKIPGVKRVVEVRLSERMSRADLQRAGHAVLALDDSTYDRTFVTYLLPNQKSGSGCWATTHFNPDMEVKILHLTKGEAAHLASGRPTMQGARLLGHWIGDAFAESMFLRGEEIVLRWTDPEANSDHVDFVYPFDSSKLQHAEIKDGQLKLLKGNAFGDSRILNRNGIILDADADGTFGRSARPIHFDVSLFSEIVNRR